MSEPAAEPLRADVLLHRLCLTKSRSEAKAACEAGAVAVDGKRPRERRGAGGAANRGKYPARHAGGGAAGHAGEERLEEEAAATCTACCARSGPRRRALGVSPVRIAVTLGDPRGIGPEVTEAALADREIAGAASFVRVGPDALVGPDGVGVGGWTAADGAAAAGRVAGEAIRRAVAMAMAGEVDAIVTAPIDKAAFHAGGWNYPGHTEMLAELAGVPRVAMLMAAERTALGGPLRVVLATTHLALRDVPAALSAGCWWSRRR